MKKWLMLSTLLVLLATRVAAADVLVLVHGYLGTAQSWAEAGTLARLTQRGYRLVGILGYSAQGVVYQAVSTAKTDKPVYAVNLPSQAPIVIQADWLAAQLREIRRLRPDEPINLVAHSAGGVVARMTLVRHGVLGVKHLITIATPHFGTGRAVQALQATDSGGMFGFVKSWLVRRATGDALYATVRQSRGVLFDLLPPAPGNLLFWLNQQPHPKIAYTSIMRIGNFYMPGDQVVPSLSQDLNRAPALAGRVKTYSMAEGHLLTPQDGDLIGNLLLSPAKKKSQ
ncbi:MAG: alpha/beta fold hydrolase [Gammaproteobacteria bacterium]|nr:alpha/beta fold hydrolase [Gammaproteobacteria bacterium]MCB1925109.1 alpha/beta fold hydrolase [Gammaproteobacteria bacterium]